MLESEFMRLFNELSVAYGKEFSKERALVYFKYLGGLDVEYFRKAVEGYVNGGSEFFPTVAQLREIINPPDTGKSWEKIVSIASMGCRSWKQLTDTEIATVSAIGGMNLIQNSNEEGLKFIFNDFQKTFPVMAKRDNKFNSDDERLKTLNMQAETFKFLQKQLQPALPLSNKLNSMASSLAKTKGV